MRVVVRDRTVLERLRPEDMAHYLRAKGWIQVEEEPARAAVWRRGEDHAHDVLLPLSRHFRDYAQRVSEVLAILEIVEARSQLAILNDLSAPTSDVLRIRVVRTDTESGSIPLEAGARLFRSSRDLLLAAASSAVRPRPFHQGHPPAQASAFLENARLGQTERGSYIVTVFSPVPPIIQGELFGAQEPFERKVLRTLVSSLSSLRSNVYTSTIDALTAAVPEGLSANLCSAVSHMGEDEPFQSLDLSVAWSPTHPVPPGTPQYVAFEAETISRVREVAEVLKEATPVEDFEAQGFVFRLQREDASVDEESGTVSILAPVDGYPRKISVVLQGEDHTQAIRAYEDRLPVFCRGQLIKERGIYKLLAPRDFRILLIEVPPPTGVL